MLKIQSRRDFISYLFLMPVLIFFSIFIYIPLIFSFICSLSSFESLNTLKFVGLKNFIEMINDDVFWISLKNTLIITSIDLIAKLFGSLLVALGFNSVIRGRRFFETAYYLPAVASIIVTGVIWSWMYFPEYGIVDITLKSLGLPTFLWLGDSRFAIYSIIFVLFWKDVGLFGIVFLAGLQAIPRSFYDSAKIDGAGFFSVLRHITLPLLKPSILFVIVMVTAWDLPQMALPYQMTKGGPGYSTTTLMLYIYLQGFQAWRLGYASAMTFALVCIALIFAYIQWRTLKTEVLY